MFGFSVVLVLLWLFEFGLPRELKKMVYLVKLTQPFVESRLLTILSSVSL